MRSLLPALPIFALVPTLFGLPTEAQTAKAAPPMPKKLTLAQALAALPTPADGLRLTVSAERVTLPDGTDPPPPGASASDVAAAFGDQTASFGTVTAVAPSSMVLLNTQPDPPDLSDAGGTVTLSVLCAGLDDAQWQALTSEHGLGLADLTDDVQRGLFRAWFTHGQLLVGSEDPALADIPQEQRTDVRDLSSAIDSTRFRLSQTAQLHLYDTNGGTIYSTGRPDAAQRLHTYRPKTPPLSAEHAVTLRAAVPNALKPSDLDLDRNVLQASVSVVELKTVGDLVTRIGLKSGLELYADPHYAAKSLSVTGMAASAPAGDLLRALCLCVTGTFRKVGPAWVLTDDLVGIGVRRKHLSDWEQQASRTGNEMRQHAAQITLEHHGADVRKLQAFGDPLGMTPEELAALPADPTLPSLPIVFTTPYPFAKLSLPQQALMRQSADLYNEKRISGESSPSEEAQADPDLKHNVGLRMNVQLQLIVPSESKPIDTNSTSLIISLFWPDLSTLMAKEQPIEDAAKAEALAKLPPAPPLSATLHLGRRRAVLAHPRTASDVDSLVAAMQKLSLNYLYLDVFSDGVDHIKTSAARGTDILTEALARTHGTGISVSADLSLLNWSEASPESLRDLTIDGQTNRDAAIEKNKTDPDPDFDDDGPIPFTAPPVRVTPAAVGAALTALVQDLSARPGLAGLVLEDADPDSELGYTLQMRLAFLRGNHADPVDIGPPQQSSLRADDTLPLFDDAAVDGTLPEQWESARTNSYAAMLDQLRAASRRGVGAFLQILTKQQSFTDAWYLSWDDPRQSPTALRERSADGVYVPRDKILAIGKTPGWIALRREIIKNDGDTAALARKLTEDAKILPGAGFVLDFRDDAVTQGAAPLDSLVRAVSVQKTVK